VQNENVLFAGRAGEAVNAKAHVVLPPPKIEPLHEVFAEAILEDTSLHQRRSALDWVASVGVHFAILAMLLIAPLYFTAGINYQKLNLTFLAPPAMPAAPPPPPIASAAARPARAIPVRVFNAGKLTAPSFIPKAIVTTPEAPEAPPDDAFVGVPGGIAGGQTGGVIGGVLGGVPRGVPPPPVAAVAKGPVAPVRVGGDVKPPRLLFAPDPEYPVLARQARLAGVVVIEAIIDEHGNVKGMQVISGHPILIPAALAAVSKRKYEPTVLDGEPTPVDLRVEINFRFS
jgi:protein TonB